MLHVASRPASALSSTSDVTDGPAPLVLIFLFFNHVLDGDSLLTVSQILHTPRGLINISGAYYMYIRLYFLYLNANVSKRRG